MLKDLQLFVREHVKKIIVDLAGDLSGHLFRSYLSSLEHVSNHIHGDLPRCQKGKGNDQTDDDGVKHGDNQISNGNQSSISLHSGALRAKDQQEVEDDRGSYVNEQPSQIIPPEANRFDVGVSNSIDRSNGIEESGKHIGNNLKFGVINNKSC